MKEPGLDDRHRDGRGRYGETKGRALTEKRLQSTGTKVNREKLARAFDSASKSTGAFTSKRAK